MTLFQINNYTYGEMDGKSLVVESTVLIYGCNIVLDPYNNLGWNPESKLFNKRAF